MASKKKPNKNLERKLRGRAGNVGNQESTTEPQGGRLDSIVQAAPPSKRDDLISKKGILQANFFNVKFGEVKELYRYSLSIRGLPRGVDSKADDGLNNNPATPDQKSRSPNRKSPSPNQTLGSRSPRGQLGQKSPKSGSGKGLLGSQLPIRGSSSGPNPEPATNTQDIKDPSPRAIRRVVYLLITVNLCHLQRQGIKIATDYAGQLITTKRLPENVSDEHVVDYYDEDSGKHRVRGPRYHVTIGKPDTLSFDVLKGGETRSNQSQGEVGSTIEEIIQALNLIFSYRPQQFSHRRPDLEPPIACVEMSKVYQIARNQQSFDPMLGPWEIANGLKAYPGFFKSVRMTATGSVFLNVNTTTGAFYPEGGLSNLIKASGLSTARLASFLKGVRIKTTYLRDSSLRSNPKLPVQEKIFTITGFPKLENGVDPVPGNVYFEETLESKESQTVSVGQYFHKKHKINLKNELVISLGRKPIYIPAELLTVLSGQRVKDKVEMAAQAVRLPAENKTMILRNGLSILGIQQPDQTWGPNHTFGIDLDQDMTPVTVHLLVQPPLAYNDKQNKIRAVSSDYKDNGISGTWNLKERKFVVPTSNVKWTYMVLWGGQDAQRVPEFQSRLTNAMTQYGLRNFAFTNANSNPVPCQRGNTEDQDGNTIFSRIKEFQSKHRIQLVVVLLPEKDTQLYSIVKRIGRQKLGMHTVCMVCGHHKDKSSNEKWRGPKLDNGFLANICMKINLKTSQNAANQVLQKGTPILTENTMIMGIDVWPASFKENPRPELAMGTEAGAYRNVKESMEEILALKEMIVERLRAYLHVRVKLPEKIIFYRDGLSETQFKMCKTKELPQIKAAINEFDIEMKFPIAKILLVCAIKRHHCRLFPITDTKLSQGLLDPNKNPVPGCLVESQITLGGNQDGIQDFYLVSHCAIKGTARPTHYVILENQLGAEVREIASMIYNLCYLFGRATRSVGVVPAAYYADLAADRARIYVRNVYSPVRIEPFEGQNSRHKFKIALQRDIAGSMFYI